MLLRTWKNVLLSGVIWRWLKSYPKLFSELPSGFDIGVSSLWTLATLYPGYCPALIWFTNVSLSITVPLSKSKNHSFLPVSVSFKTITGFFESILFFSSERSSWYFLESFFWFIVSISSLFFNALLSNSANSFLEDAFSPYFLLL